MRHRSPRNSGFFSDIFFGETIFHGGGSRDILFVYSDRTGKKIDHYFLNTQ